MEKIEIDLGWVNGLNEGQLDFYHKAVDLLNSNPETVRTSETIGHCEHKMVLENKEYKLTYYVDSSD